VSTIFSAQSPKTFTLSEEVFPIVLDINPLAISFPAYRRYGIAIEPSVFNVWNIFANYFFFLKSVNF
jgi:hypothetical protein